ISNRCVFISLSMQDSDGCASKSIQAHTTVLRLPSCILVFVFFSVLPRLIGSRYSLSTLHEVAARDCGSWRPYDESSAEISRLLCDFEQMKTKRILYLLYFDGSETGGHASHARGVVCALARQGCEVKVIAPGWPINISKRIEVSRVWQWKRPRFHTLTFMLFGLPIFVFELLRYRPTVIYARY